MGNVFYICYISYPLSSSLNVKAVLLVRDPRGTMSSRSRLGWCKNQPDCDRPDRLCKDLVDDYYAAKVKLARMFPDRFT